MNKLIVIALAIISFNSSAKKLDPFELSARCASFASHWKPEAGKQHIHLASLNMSKAELAYEFGVGTGIIISLARVKQTEQKTIAEALYKSAKCVDLLSVSI